MGVRISHILNAAIISLIALEFCFFIWFLSGLSIDYFDAFDNLVNAAGIAGNQPLRAHFNFERPPLISLLNAPFMFGMEGGARGLPWLGPHALSLVISFVSLIVLHLYLRQSESSAWAFCGVALLAANPLFIHYSPFVMSDILLGLLFTLTGYFYLRGRTRGRRRDLYMAATFFTLALLTKYVAGLYFFVLCGWELARYWRDRDSLKEGVVILGVLIIATLAVWFGVHLVVYYVVVPEEGLQFDLLWSIFRWQRANANLSYGLDPAWEYLQCLPTVLSAGGTVFLLLGLAVALRRRDDVSLFNAAWFLAALAILTSITHKEGRYLFALLTPAVWLMVTGIRTAWEWRRTENRFAGRPMGVAMLVMGLMLFGEVGFRAAEQVSRLTDPVYRTTVPGELVETIRQHAPTAEPVYWIGELYTFYPRRLDFLPNDEFIYFYHFGPDQLAFLLARPVIKIDAQSPDEFLDKSEPGRYVLIEVTGPSYTRVHPPPENPPPLHVYTCEQNDSTSPVVYGFRPPA